MESQCFSSVHGVKGDRVLTQDAWAIFYDLHNYVSADEIIKKRDLEGINTLLVCRNYFDENM